jgi:hypothetical protein
LLPRERTIESKAVILGPPDKVFDFATDVKRYATWRDDLSNVEIDEGSDPLSWSETTSGWKLNFRVVKSERPELLPEPKKSDTAVPPKLWKGGVFEVAFESPSGFSGRRTYEFEPTDSGDRTQLKRTDTFEISNPLRRVYAYLAVNLQRSVDTQSEDLGREFLSNAFDAAPTGSAAASPTASPTGMAPTGTAPTVTAPTGTAPSVTAPTGTLPAPIIGVPTPTGPIPAVSAPTAPASPSPSPAPAGTVPSASGTPSPPTPSGSPTPTPSRI